MDCKKLHGLILGRAVYIPWADSSYSSTSIIGRSVHR